MKPNYTITVRPLVDFVLRCGDLRAEYTGALSAKEGMRAHQRIQSRRPSGYQSEVPVRHVVAQPDFDLCISGRIDGVLSGGGHTMVEEIKTTQRPLEVLEASSSPVHWGQAQCYAFMLACAEGLAEVDVQLTYVHAESGRVLELQRHLSMEALTLFFEDLVGRYLPWLRRHTLWIVTRDRSLDQLGFPFPDYRPGQRTMAVAVFRTIRDGRHLLVQAATGIGKTMATLFPAVKALGKGRAAKLVFLTARSTGRIAAETALQTLGRSGMRLKWVSLTAKEKICFSPDAACMPDSCDFACGHYDRINAALAVALAHDALDRASIEQVARDHQVCPFELSLELIDWTDGLIGDYNYAFDPHVTLQRLFGTEQSAPVVLVDEAHNLVDRSREMFSAQLTKSTALAVRRRLKKSAPGLHRSLGRINSWFLAQRPDCAASGGTCIREKVPDDLLERVRGFMGSADRWLRKNPTAVGREALLPYYFECLRFVRIADQFCPAYATIVQADEGDVRVKLFCMDPSEGLRNCWRRCKAAVLFSATLTPAGYFRSILGCQTEAGTLNLDSPFPPENLSVFVAPHISTLYAQREESCAAVSHTLATLVTAQRGNYLLFFPSYDYLHMVYRRFCRDHPDIEVILQTAVMGEADRTVFLARFESQATRTLVGFAVMGGIFGEGIDLKGDRLTGAAVIGVGLPGISTERELIKDYFDRRHGSGFAFAYQYPGINRVLQAAGRVIRSELDRGVVLLVDQRFIRQPYRSLLPGHWHMCMVTSEAAFQNQLAKFWPCGGKADESVQACVKQG